MSMKAHLWRDAPLDKLRHIKPIIKYRNVSSMAVINESGGGGGNVFFFNEAAAA